MEAEKIDQQLATKTESRPAASSEKSAEPDAQQASSPSKMPASPPPDVAEPKVVLPEHLRNLVSVPLMELEDMKNGGMLSEDDFHQVMLARGETV